MQGTRRQKTRSMLWAKPKPAAAVAATAARPVANAVTREARVVSSGAGAHPLARVQENQALFQYEENVKNAFDSIVPTLKAVSALQHEGDFENQAQRIARQELGFELPDTILADAWIDQLDMRSLFAWCVFETYHRFCDDFFSNELLIQDKNFQSFLIECGFHTFDISPCADGRLAHVISYVLRLPFKEVRRKSYAGAMFDIEDSLTKWTETELKRFREGVPTTSDQPTRYLKTVVYHFSSGQPDHEGCAAHGSDTDAAAAAGLERLNAFQQAVQNSYCCGAGIDLLLIGLDTDTDAIRVHIPDNQGNIDLATYVDAQQLYQKTGSMSAEQAESEIDRAIHTVAPQAALGMQKLVRHLLINNMSQINYVKQYYGQRYEDIGHNERFIGAGIGFEEVQLRNLTYFAYLHTVEEATADLDVGIKIFSHLNVSHGLPIPVVVRYDYHGNVPGARERAIEHCQRVANAMRDRYHELVEKELLHTLLVIRDLSRNEPIEILESSVNANRVQEGH